MYSGSRHVSSSFAYGTVTRSGLLSQNSSARLEESLMRSEPRSARTTVWALPVSLAATPGIDVSFSSSGYLDVSVHRVPSVYLWIQYTVTGVFPAGFPHSDTCGSMDICSSPQLFAAYHVFLRLLVPRHPPCALVRLTFVRSHPFTHSGLREFACSFKIASQWNMLTLVSCSYDLSSKCFDLNQVSCHLNVTFFSLSLYSVITNVFTSLLSLG